MEFHLVRNRNILCGGSVVGVAGSDVVVCSRTEIGGPYFRGLSGPGNVNQAATFLLLRLQV